MKINQYCSVCKKHLDMEVIPTDDGGDDGVIWLRCPDCQGFLPKFTGEGMTAAPPTGEAVVADSETEADPGTTAEPDITTAPGESVVDDAIDEVDDVDDESPTRPRRKAKGEDEADAGPVEPIAEYAALLAAADLESARPYRPSSTYAVGDVIHHLAYGDVGIVVAREPLPGGRQTVKVFFEDAGVVHLIEQAPDGH